MRVTSAGAPILTDAGVPIDPNATLPDWPLSVVLTLTDTSFNRDYSTSPPENIDYCTWHPEDGGHCRITLESGLRGGASGNIYSGDHGGPRNGGPPNYEYSAIWKARVNDEFVNLTTYIANGAVGPYKGPKMFVGYANDGSCAWNELTITNTAAIGSQWSYTNCGQSGIQYRYTGGHRNLQPGGETERWSNSSPAGPPAGWDPVLPTYYFQPDIWTTYLVYYRGLGQPAGSRFYELWCHAEGGDPQFADQWVNVVNYDFNASDLATGRALHYEDHGGLGPSELSRFYLGPYFTDKETGIPHTPIQLDLKDGYMVGPYDYRPIMAHGKWKGPHIPDKDSSEF